jgi:hypothetical protein
MMSLTEEARYGDASGQTPDQSSAGPGHALEKAAAINAVRTYAALIRIKSQFDRMNMVA